MRLGDGATGQGQSGKGLKGLKGPLEVAGLAKQLAKKSAVMLEPATPATPVACTFRNLRLRASLLLA